MNIFKPIRIFLISLAVIEIIYVGIFLWLADNGALLKLVNRDDSKYSVIWDEITSNFPGHFSFKNLQIRFHTRNLQGQLDSSDGSFWISPFDLLFKSVTLNGARFSNSSMQLRSLSLVRKSPASMLDFFPTIDGYRPFNSSDIADIGPSRPSWSMNINEGVITGKHDFWIGPHRFFGSGTLTASAQRDKYGELVIDDGLADIENMEVFTNDNAVVTNVNVSGEFEFSSFQPRYHSGIKKLKFLKSDLLLSGSIESIEFLNFYLLSETRQQWQGLSGRGSFDGRLVSDEGQIITPTQVSLSTDQLSLETNQLQLESSGNIVLKPGDEILSEYGLLQFSFSKILLRHVDTQNILAELNNMQFNVTGSSAGLATPIENIGLIARFANSDIPNLSVLNSFIPANVPITVLDGSGSLAGEIIWKNRRMDGSLTLSADNTLIETETLELQSDVELFLKLSADASSKSISIAGSKIKFDRTVINNSNATTQPWDAQLQIDDGTLQLLSLEGSLIREKKSLVKLAEFTDGVLRVAGDISDIGFINTLLTEDDRFKVNGPGKLSLNLFMAQGWIAQGSAINFTAENLKASFLEYLAEGRGGIQAEVVNQKGARELSIKTSLVKVTVRKQDTSQLLMTTPGVNFFVSGQFPHIKKPLTNIDVTFQIENATVPDITVYNTYFPEHSSFSFLQGSGVLNSTFNLDLINANGKIHMHAPGIRIGLNGNELKFDLDFSLQLENGDLRQSRFDIKQSEIKVSNLGESKTTGYSENWKAKILMPNGTITWTTPLYFAADAKLKMDSTGPLLELLLGRDESRKIKWIKELLSVGNIQGGAEIRLQDDSLLINNLDISGDELRVAAKLKYQNNSLKGIVFNKYGLFSTGVTIDGDDRDWHILRPHRNYLEYPEF